MTNANHSVGTVIINPAAQTIDEIKPGLTDNNQSNLAVTLPESGKRTSTKNRLTRIGLMILTSLLATINGSIAKYLHIIPIGELVFITGIYSLCTFSVVIAIKGISIFEFSSKKLVAARVLVGTVSYLARVWSFQILPLGDAGALVSTGPLFVGFIARIFIKEKLTLVDILTMFLGLCGVVLISKPGIFYKTDEEQLPWFYFMVPVFSAFCMAVANVMQRKLGATVNSVTISFYIKVALLVIGFGYQSIISGTPFPLLPGCFIPRYLLVLTGVFQVGYFVVANMTLEYEKATTATIFRNLDTTLAFIVQATLFSVPIEMVSVAGALLIVFGTVGLTFAKIFNFTCGVEF